MYELCVNILLLGSWGSNLALGFLQFDSIAEAEWTLSLGRAFVEAGLGGVELEVSPVEGGGVGEADLVRGGGGEDDQGGEGGGRGHCSSQCYTGSTGGRGVRVHQAAVYCSTADSAAAGTPRPACSSDGVNACYMLFLLITMVRYYYTMLFIISHY